MAAHLEVVLDNHRLVEQQLSPLIAAWRAGESSTLQLVPPHTGLSTLHAAELRQLHRGRAALHTTDVWKTKPTPNEALTDTALQFVKAFPLLPIPMIPSPLYMLLNDTDAEANKYPVVKNSFELLRFFSWAEKIIYEQCDEVSKTRKKKAHDEIQRWLVSVAKEALSTFAKICLLPQDLAVEHLQKELFYNNLNALRIIEYTILDELAVGTTSQNAFTTADWYWLPTLTPTPAAPPAVYAEIRSELQRTFAIFTERVGGARPAWSELVSTYDPQCLAGQAATIKAFLREVLSLRLFACQNREGKCTKQETTAGEFKSCGRCGWFRYCSKECQTMHWRLGHKMKCGSADVKNEIPRIIVAADEDEEPGKK